MVSGRSRQRLVDWIGFLFMSVFALGVWRRNAMVGLAISPVLIHEWIGAVSFLIRRAPRRRLTSIGARFAAYGVTFLVPVYSAVATPHLLFSSPLALRCFAVALWLGGCVVCIWGTWNLRYSFSIEPQARNLVTTGPYGWVRHPIYAAYALEYLAALLVRPSIGFAIVLATWFALLWLRIGYEESVLTSTFDTAYAHYRARVGALLPKFRRPEAPAPDAASTVFPSFEVQP